MAENLTLARPYAEAAFQLASGSGEKSAALAAWSSALSRLAAVVNSPAMAECLGNPQIGAEQLAQLCMSAAGEPLTAEQRNFVQVLVENQRLSVLPEISTLFDALKAGAEGIKQAEIVSAFPIDEVTQQNLIADLERKFGCRIEATVRIDRELIGGVRVAIGDEVIDASVRGKLAAMAATLKN
jgi:F-type H+-transporting ATPase subunit delta